MYPILRRNIYNAQQRYLHLNPRRRQRAVIIIVFIILILFFKNKISSAIRDLFHKDINKLDVDSNKLSYSKSTYYSICSTLDSSMQGTGTDESSVMSSISKMRTQDDWNYLQKCFGIREKDGGTFYADLTGDLKAWFSDDLDSAEMELLKKMLISNGITY